MAMLKKKAPKVNVGEYPYADIMPVSRRETIDRNKARKQWTKIVINGLVVAIVISLGSVGFRIFEQINYNNAINQQTALEAEIDTYSPVDDALTIRDLLQKNILTSSASAIGWQDLLARVSSNLPPESALGSWQVVTGGISEEENSPTVSVLVTVSSLQPIAYSQVLDAFGSVPGIIGDSLLIGDMVSAQNESTTVYMYPVAFVVNETILAHIFKHLTEDAQPATAPEKIEEAETGGNEELDSAIEEINNNEEAENSTTEGEES